MTDSELTLVTSLLDQWFGTLGPSGTVAPEVIQQWWKKDPAFDALLRAHYETWVQRALRDELAHFAAQPKSGLARILLLDQLPRNIYRDTERMFAGDSLAVAATVEALKQKWHWALPEVQQVFALMPLMHSEDLQHQERAVEEFEALRARSQQALWEMLDRNVEFAKAHQAIIARFGRFPHRNALLNRSSSKQELEFLATPGSSF